MRMAKKKKKEAREAKRIAELDAKQAESRQNMVKWIVIGAVSVLFLGLFVFLLVNTKQSNNSSTNDPSGDVVTFSDVGHVLGPTVAVATPTPQLSPASEAGPSGAMQDDGQSNVVEIVEFADFQCPACAAYHPTVKQVLSDNPDTVRYVFKHFPLTFAHPNAEIAAYAAEAAGAQGKFFEMTDLLFTRQQEWSGESNPRALFVEYAQELELDGERFGQDLDNEELHAVVSANADEGIEIGVNSTPTFFLNGRKLTNQPNNASAFQDLIDSALQQ